MMSQDRDFRRYQEQGQSQPVYCHRSQVMEGSTEAAVILQRQPDWYPGYSTGGKNNLLGISKRGDKNLRRLLVQCARSLMQRREHQAGSLADRVKGQLERKHSNVVACARANKLARIAGVITTQHTEFKR